MQSWSPQSLGSPLSMLKVRPIMIRPFSQVPNLRLGVRALQKAPSVVSRPRAPCAAGTWPEISPGNQPGRSPQLPRVQSVLRVPTQWSGSSDPGRPCPLLCPFQCDRALEPEHGTDSLLDGEAARTCVASHSSGASAHGTGSEPFNPQGRRYCEHKSRIVGTG